MSKKFKVTLVGTRRVGKTALAHWAVNTGPRTTYDATANPIPFLFQLEHPENGKCLVELEDTTGYKPDPKGLEKEERPTPPPELLEPAVAYMFCDDGVRKPGGEAPPEEEEEEEEGEEEDATKAPGEKQKLMELETVSAVDVKQDRQGFVVVYSEVDKDSFEEAKKLLSDIQVRMSKPPADAASGEDEEEPDPDEEPPEIPPLPIVLVATHADAKKTDKRRGKTDKFVTKDEGLNLAEEFGIPFYETNAARGGKHVKDVFIDVVSAIQKVEDNLVWDKGPSCCERFLDWCPCCCAWCRCWLRCSCQKCCSTLCCILTFGCFCND